MQNRRTGLASVNFFYNKNLFVVCKWTINYVRL